MTEKKIGFVGTDGRTLLAALETSRSKSELYPGAYRGVVVKGTGAMEPLARKMGWPVDFIPVPDNSAPSYAEALIRAFEAGDLDVALVMPEGLLFEGLVDRVADAGFGDRIIGVAAAGVSYEADKIAGKRYCEQAGIPVAPAWTEVEARDYPAVLKTCLAYLHEFGGAVLKYPYSAGGKGARIMLNTWDVKDVYDGLMKDYKDAYSRGCGKKSPGPCSSRPACPGWKSSFTILVDKAGHYQILPTAMDYPERFERPPGLDNPITGGMGAISPHPLESPALMELADETIGRPLIRSLKRRAFCAPVSSIRAASSLCPAISSPRPSGCAEINLRPGEPEFQPVVKRLRNLGPMVAAMADGSLDKVAPEVRSDQVSLCIALVTGPGGPKQQKGYPWSLTKGEVVEMDFDYFDKKKLTVIPSAMDYAEGVFESDGSRVAYLMANATVKAGQTAARPPSLCAKSYSTPLTTARSG